MNAIIRALTEVISKNWKGIAFVFGGIGTSILTFFLGKDYGYKKAEKQLKVQREALRKTEAEIRILEDKAKKTRDDKRQIKKLKKEVEGHREYINELEEKLSQ